MQALKPTETTVLVYLRRQDRLLASLYMQRIHGGGTVKWSAFRDRVGSDDRIRFGHLLESFEAADCVASIRVRPFEIIELGAPTFVADFLGSVGLGQMLEHVQHFRSSNPSYTEPAWKAAMKLNRLVSTPAQVRQVRLFLRELFPADEYPRAQLLTQSERLDLLVRYAPDNEDVFRRYMADFPRETYSRLDTLAHIASVVRPVPSVQTPVHKPASSR